MRCFSFRLTSNCFLKGELVNISYYAPTVLRFSFLSHTQKDRVYRRY
jgi:hypothetical protein